MAALDEPGSQLAFAFGSSRHQNIRGMDFLARCGGEEFVILMPDMDMRSAKDAAERLRQMIVQKPLVVSSKMDVPVTISIGVAIWHSTNPIKVSALLDRADQALYKSKKAGRNRVTVWRDTDLIERI